MKALLERTIGTLPKLDAPLPAIPQPDHTPTPGVYVINKEDVNQGRVSYGHIGYKLGDPDEFALMIGNDILGGGGFTSRMMKTIRSDEGLAYGAYSTIGFPTTYPGTFRALFQSKSSTCAYAAELGFNIIGELRADDGDRRRAHGLQEPVHRDLPEELFIGGPDRLGLRRRRTPRPVARLLDRLSGQGQGGGRRRRSTRPSRRRSTRRR